MGLTFGWVLIHEEELFIRRVRKRKKNVRRWSRNPTLTGPSHPALFSKNLFFSGWGHFEGLQLRLTWFVRFQSNLACWKINLSPTKACWNLTILKLISYNPNKFCFLDLDKIIKLSKSCDKPSSFQHVWLVYVNEMRDSIIERIRDFLHSWSDDKF